MMDADITYKLQMPGGTLIGDPQCKPLNFQMKIWGPERSTVWPSMDNSLYGDVDDVCVMGEWLAEEVKSKRRRRPGTNQGGKNIFKDLNVNVCLVR